MPVWGLMPFSTVFQLYWWRKQEHQEKTYHVMQGCGIAMPDSSDSYIEPAGQVDFPD